MPLVKPVMAKSDDRTILAARSPYCGEPTEWFDTEYFRAQGLHCVTFDFFVNWENDTVQNTVWQKRIIRGTLPTEPEDILAEICRCDGREQVEELLAFCQVHGFSLDYLLLPEIPASAWKNERNKITIFHLSDHAAGRSSVLQTVSAAQLREIIRALRKDPHRIGGKGLTWSSSSLEAYLATTDTIYPGDADLILYDSQYRPLAIIEFKKHTPSGDYICAFSHESLYHYNGVNRSRLEDPKYKNDVLKFKSLGLLKDRLGCGLVMLFFPTTKDRQAKLQRLEGPYDQLLVSDELLTELPQPADRASLERFCDRFLAYMASGILPAGPHVGNRGNRSFHRPHCQYAPKNPQKRVEFFSREDAVNAEYRPCPTCRP